jgi:hypothetical protein
VISDIPLRTNPLTERWHIVAGARVRFPVYLDSRESHASLQGAVGGVPAAWVKTFYTTGVVWVEISVPLQTASGNYPISLTLTSDGEPRKRTTIPLTLEIQPAIGRKAPALPEFRLSPRWVALMLGMGIVVWLGVSFWWGSQRGEATVNPVTIMVGDGVALPPLAQVPVVIGAEWQAGLATPTIAPTPTLRPTPTPLPPLPTPQPPPAPARTAETLVDGVYTYERMFQEVGSQFNIDWRLLASIAQRESQLRTDAIGGSGEEGMMQIMPETWQEFAPRVGESDPFNAYSSTRVAAYYLVYLRDYLYSEGYTESYWLLVAYNWGPNNLRRHLANGGDWGSIPTIRQNYAYTIVDRVNDPNDSLWTELVRQEVPE